MDWCQRQGLTLSDHSFADKGLSAWRGRSLREGQLAELVKILKPGDRVLIEDNGRFSNQDPITAMSNLREFVSKGDLEPRFQSLEKGQEEIRTALGSLADKLDKISGVLFDRVNAVSRPNFANIWAAAVVVIMFLSAVAGPIGYFVMRDMDRSSARIDRLEQLREEQVKADLEELRQRRMVIKPNM